MSGRASSRWICPAIGTKCLQWIGVRMGKRLAVEGKTRLFGFGGTEVYRLIQLSFPELYHFIAPILNQHLDYFCS